MSASGDDSGSIIGTLLDGAWGPLVGSADSDSAVENTEKVADTAGEAVDETADSITSALDVRNVIVDFILGGLAGILFSIVEFIDLGFTVTIDAFVSAGSTLYAPFAAAGAGILGFVVDINQFVILTGQGFGVPGAYLTPILYALEIALVLRAIPPVVTFLVEIVGSIPVIGGLFSGLYRAATSYFGGLLNG